MSQPREPKHFIRALARGLAVLQAFTPERPRLTLQALADLTGLNKTAAQRQTDTLLTLGFLGRNRHKEFYLEPKVLTLGFAYLGGNQVRHLGETHLGELGRRLDCSANLAVLDGIDVIVVHRHEVRTFFSFSLKVGSKLPVHATSLGKILLAGLDRAELEERLSQIRLTPLTPRTIIDPDLFRAEIEAARRRGVAVCDREGTLALTSLAVPVMDHEGRMAAALGVSLPADRAQTEGLSGPVGELIRLGRRCSELLGFSGVYPWPGADLRLEPGMSLEADR